MRARARIAAAPTELRATWSHWDRLRHTSTQGVGAAHPTGLAHRPPAAAAHCLAEQAIDFAADRDDRFARMNWNFILGALYPPP
jgi:hypothetical protein